MTTAVPSPPVVLVHGWAGSSRVWDRTRHELELRDPGRHVVAVDLPGSPRLGLSDVVRDRSALIEAAASVVGVLDRLGEPVLLVGHSMGGQVTLLVHGTRPDLVCAEVVLDPAYNDVRSRAELQAWAREIERRGHRGLDAFFTRALGERVPDADAAQVLSDVRDTPLDAIVAYLYAEYLDADSVGRAADTRDWAARRVHPVLAIHTSPEAAALERALPSPEGSSVLCWGGFGHYLQLESPGAVASAISGWASELPAVAVVA